MKNVVLGLLLVFAISFGFATSAFAQNYTRAEVRVKGMVCGFCAQGIKSKFKKQQLVQKLDVSLEKGLVEIYFLKGHSLSDQAITSAIEDAGFSVDKIEWSGN